MPAIIPLIIPSINCHSKLASRIIIRDNKSYSSKPKIINESEMITLNINNVIQLTFDLKIRIIFIRITIKPIINGRYGSRYTNIFILSSPHFQILKKLNIGS